MVSDRIVEEIRARADILEIVSEYVPLKRSGKSYRGPCPLHGGKGPNFAVDPQRQIFKCFVCDEGGDVFGFLMKHLGHEFPDAVRLVGAKIGVEVPEPGEAREDPHAPLRSVLAFAAEWFQGRLQEPTGEVARNYLKGRGLSVEQALKFGIGFADDEWRAFRDAADRHGIARSVLLELGLLATSERAEEPYDRFRGRLMFTIQDLRDRPIGFGGRILDPRSDAPKYINSPESPVFQKGEELYALNLARHSIRRDGRVAIAEGYTDVIALHRAGLTFAVAGLGTSFTRAQARHLARYARRPSGGGQSEELRAFLLYDSDEAGLRATFRTGDILLAAGVHPMVVTLPPGEDPDSLIRREGPDAVRHLMDDAVDLLERKLQILDRGGLLASVEGRRRAVDKLLPTLRAVSDETLRDIYIDHVVERVGTRRETIVHEIARARPGPGTHPPGSGRGGGEWTPGERSAVAGTITGGQAQSASEAGPQRGEADGERKFLLLLVRDPTLTRRAMRMGLSPEHLHDPVVREIFSLLAMAADEGEEADWSAASAEAQLRRDEMQATEEEIRDPGQVFDEITRKLRYRDKHARRHEIDRAMQLAQPDQQRRLLDEKQKLARELRDAKEAATFMPRRGTPSGG